MKKNNMLGKFTAFFLSLAVMFSVVATPIGEIVGFGGSLVASAATVSKSTVLARISELEGLFPQGSHFTVTGATCSPGHSPSKEVCSNCKLDNILKNNNTAKNTRVPSICTDSGRRACYTCVAFGRFAFCYIWGHDSNTNTNTIKSSTYGGVNDDFVSKLHPGDLLNGFNYNDEGELAFAHAMIVKSVDLESNLITVCEANINSSSSNIGEVKYTRTVSYSRYKQLNAVQSKSYVETLDLTSSPISIGTSFTSTIKCTSTGLLLTADSSGNVTAKAAANNDYQMWKFTKNSGDNYYEIKNVKTGKCLDVANGSNSDGANIRVWEDNDTSSQRFGVYGSQGSYILKVKHSTTHVVDSDGGVHLWTYAENIAAQKFTIVPDPSPQFGNFEIKYVKTNDARVDGESYKPASATAVKFGIMYQDGTGNINFFDAPASKSYVGSTVVKLNFQFVNELKVTLKPDTLYYYSFYAVYDFGNGEQRTYTSSIQTFKTAAVENHTHSYGAWTTTKAATCTAAGTKTRTCSCGKTETQAIAAVGHSYGSWTTTKAATCTASGTQKRTCSKCSAYETKTLAAVGHSYGSTYYEASHPHYYGHKCSTCGYTERTGGNLAYWEKCKTCHDSVAPSKVTVSSAKSEYLVKDEVTINWTSSEKATHYNVLIEKKGTDGTYAWYDRIDYATSGTKFNLPVGEYRISVQAYNSNYFYQYTETYRDWVHTISDYRYITVKDGVVKPTITNVSPSTIYVGETVTFTWTPSPQNSAIPYYWVDVVDPNGRYIVDQSVDKSTNSFSYIPTVAGTYKFIVGAGANADDTYWEEVTFTVKTLPGVSNYRITDRTTTSVTFAWDKLEGADGYLLQIYRSTGEWEIITNIKSSNTTSYTVTGFNPGNPFDIRIAPYVYSDKNYFGTFITVSSHTKPGTADNFKATNTTSSSTLLTWDKATTLGLNDGNIGYLIEVYDTTDPDKWRQVAKITDIETTSYLVENLDPGRNYDFRIATYRYVGYTGHTVYSDNTNVSVCTHPSDITDLKIAARASDSISLSWAKNDSADGYRIEMYDGSKWVRVAKLSGNSTTAYKVENLTASTTYKFRICAYKTITGSELYSALANVTGTTTPSAVAGFTVGARVSDAIRLNWTKNASADGYIIEKYDGSAWVRVAKITSNETVTYRVEDLTASTTYKFRICAYNMVGSVALYSGYSNVTGTTVPGVVEDFRIGAAVSDAIRLNWTKNESADGYIIEQYNGSEWIRTAKLTSNATLTYRVENLTLGNTYKFRICAYNMVGDVALYSGYVNVTGKTSLSAVTGFKVAAVTSDAIRLNWDRNTGVDGYIIEKLDGDEWVRVTKITDNATTTYRVEDLTAVTAYQFRIRTYKMTGEASAVYSDCVNATGRTNLSTVKNFAVAGRAADALRFGWTKNTSADGYIIEQYNGSEWVRLAKLTDNATTEYKITGLDASTLYKFRICAYKMDGATAYYSSYSATLEARTNPTKVAGFSIGGRAADALRLSWTKNTTADGYIIEKYDGSEWVRVAKITDNATTTYRVENLSASTLYKFRICSYKMDGTTPYYSYYSDTLSARTNPTKVANFRIGGTAEDALRFNWDKNTSADGYIIEIYKNGEWVRVVKIMSNTTLTYRVENLAHATTYKFRICSYKMDGTTPYYSYYSDTLTASTL